jgi:arylsulfatase A-like enzyme
MVCNGRSELCGANIVLVVLDSVRYDHLGHNGYQRNTTPHLDRLAKESIVFDSAYSHAPWTHPSVASIMTGMHPVDHGVAQWNHKLKKRRFTLAEALHEKGYHTQAHVGSVLFKPSFGYRQGFDVYDTSVLDQGDPHQISSSKEISDTAILALSTMPEPFFLWLHYFDPHTEYLNHRAFDFPGDRPMDHYDSEIAYVDFHLGRVIEELERTGLIDRSIVVVVSDHGEEFWDHGGRFHEGKLYEELIHVPLIIRVPGLEHRRVQETFVLSDLAPTLLELIGIRKPAEFKGVPIVFGPDGVKIGNRIVFAEVRRKSNKRAIIENGDKLIVDFSGGGVQLYDLRMDPKETRNLSALKKKKVSKLLEKLLEHEQQSSKDPDVLVLDRDLAEKLRSLGYLQ